MNFSLNLYFEGLLHYVQNDSTGKVRLCVVLPKAVGHVGTISSEGDTILVGADPDGVALDGQRAVLQFDTMTSDLDFDGQVLEGAVKGAVSLVDLIGDAADQNPTIVSASPPATVRSQVLIGGGGTFSLDGGSSPPEITLPASALNGRVTFDRLEFADGFSMIVSVNSAKLVILPLTNSTVPDAVYPIRPGANGAFLRLSHTCFKATQRAVGDPDADFCFHYLMLASMPDGLTIREMPLPLIEKFSETPKNGVATNGARLTSDGCDCAGAAAAPRPIELDAFMDAATTAT
jgi:hypothetical protein